MYFADDTHAPYALLHLILIASTFEVFVEALIGLDNSCCFFCHNVYLLVFSYFR